MGFPSPKGALCETQPIRPTFPDSQGLVRRVSVRGCWPSWRELGGLTGIPSERLAGYDWRIREMGMADPSSLPLPPSAMSVTLA